MKRKIYLLLLASLLIVVSCNRVPVEPPEPVIDYITIEQLRAMFDEGIQTVDTNVYIQGIITLTPELGNIPSFVAYIQDTTAAICLTVGDADNTFSMDSEVKILCRGVSFTDYNGLLQFGDLTLSSGQVEVITLFAEAPEPEVVTIEQLLTGAWEGMYVELAGVEFKEEGTFSGSQVLTDCTSEVEVYTRSAATFSSVTRPTGNGILRGISSVYNDQQVILRDPSELDMTGDRCSTVAVTYLTQDFNTITKNANVSTLTGWLTYPQEGTKTWYGNYVSASNRWVQATAHNSGEASVITWMITPQLDFTDAVSPFISFESANGYDNGATIELFVSADYDGSATPWTFTWTKLDFTLPALSPSGWSPFVSSGRVDLTAYTGGTAYVAWVYKGAGTGTLKTTTWEVDNVLVAED